jgi:CheY-like chemotaxis protein
MSKPKILIAEDDKTTLKFYEKALDNDVFEKRFETDGEKALEAYKSWNPDILVLDIMMPGMSGYMVLKTIRKEEDDQKVTIIMATSMSDAQDIKDCLELGIQGYLVKPVDFKGMGDKILNWWLAHGETQGKSKAD